LPSPGVLRGLTALVWLYQGAWVKLLLSGEDEAGAFAAVHSLSGAGAGAALLAIGAAEAAMALWVLSGRLSLAAASLQSALILAMSAAGIMVAGEATAHAEDMAIRSFAFLTLVWCAASARGQEAET
jgi:hypothetical protein